jgi:hypothetical protein
VKKRPSPYGKSFNMVQNVLFRYFSAFPAFQIEIAKPSEPKTPKTEDNLSKDPFLFDDLMSNKVR